MATSYDDSGRVDDASGVENNGDGRGEGRVGWKSDIPVAVSVHCIVDVDANSRMAAAFPVELEDA
jgi:hypothetical protein